MAVTDDVPDDNVQPRPLLSPQYFSQTFALPKVEDATRHMTEVSSDRLLNYTSCSDSHHTATAAAAAAVTSSQYASSSVFNESSMTRCQTDDCRVLPSCSNTTSTSTSRCQSDAVPSVSVYGRDALMTSETVLQVLDMGFDYDRVRTVVHLNVVQSGEKYVRTSDLVEALLAYDIAISDVDTDTSQLNLQQPSPSQPPPSQPPPSQPPPSQPSPPQPPPPPPPPPPSQQEEEVKSAETTTGTSGWSHVGCDVTDDACSSAVTAVSCRRPAKKKKARRNKNSSRTEQSRPADTAADTAGGDDDDKPNYPRVFGQFMKLQTSTSHTGGRVERLAWEVEMENKRLRAMKTCKICLEADVAVMLMPCGHVISCHGCASLLSRCTLCETAVSNTVTVYMT